MSNTTLVLDVLEKILTNFLFNWTSLILIIFFWIGYKLLKQIKIQD